MRVDDFADFYPEQAFIGRLLIALLLADGAAKSLLVSRLFVCRAPCNEQNRNYM